MAQTTALEARSVDPITRRIREVAERARRVKAANLYYYLEPVEAVHGSTVTIGGRTMLLASSYSYLGLLGHPAIEAAARDALAHYGSGTHGVRLLAGNTDLHDRLERRIAAFVGAEAAVVYNSGFVANVAAISSLIGRGDVVICDKLNHASIVDGCRLSGAEFVRVPHNDVAAMDKALGAVPARAGRLVVVDAVFSMDGDLIDLPGVAEVCRRHNAWLMVDESHSLGVLGADGSGIEAHFGLRGAIPIKMSSLSKAIPSVGGFIAGDADLVTYLKHVSRAFVFSAALPPASTAAALTAIDLLAAEPQRVERLRARAVRLRAGLRAGGIEVRDDPTPIVPVMTGSDEAALLMTQWLFDAGIFASPVVSPAVPPNTSRLRITTTAAHSEADVDRVADGIGRAWAHVTATAAGAAAAPDASPDSPRHQPGKARAR